MKARKPKYHPYKSMLEKNLHKNQLKEFQYEPKRSIVSYISPHKYNPDFVHKNLPDVLLESKGRFRPGDTKKYKDIRDSNPGKELIFIFQNSSVKVLGAKTRKDGTTLSMGEWATSNGFLWYSSNSIPLDLQIGSVTEEWFIKEKKKQGVKI